MRIISALRDGAWVNASRLRYYPLLALIVFGFVATYLVISSTGINDGSGRPIGTDFSSVYAAGQLAQSGIPEQAYKRETLYPEQKRIFGPKTQFYGWYYPPVFQLVGERLASLPYLGALGLFMGLTALAYLVVVQAILPARGMVYAALGYGAFFMNLTHGNNGFLTAALFGGGLLLLPTRRIAAGLLLGALVYKPQFAILIPFALIAAGQWRVLLVTGLAALALLALSYLRYGADTWMAFLSGTDFTRTVVLEKGGVDFYKMQSLFAWVRQLGAGIELAYVAQGLLSVAVLVAVVRVWRSAAPYELKAVTLLAGALLATPYSFDYDLMLLAPALAFYARLGLREGFAPYEKSLLAFAWAVGLPARAVALMTGIFLGPLTLMGLMALAVKRALRPE